MEIKNCEQYVLSVLANTEKELENVKDELKRTKWNLAQLEKAISLLNPKLTKNYKDELTIVTDTICSHSTEVDRYDWYKEEAANYDTLVELLNLEYEKVED